MFKDLVLKNRSCRGYDENRVVTREELLELVDCARLAPSSVNAQPLKYYLATEKSVVEKIQPLTKWAAALPDHKLPHPGMYPPAFIVICQDLRVGESLTRYQKDVGIVAQTILLAAAEKELGGCMIGSFNAGAISSALGLAENFAPVLIVAVGKPAEQVVLTEVEGEGSTAYYRDEQDVHYVPKRKLKDIIIN